MNVPLIRNYETLHTMKYFMLCRKKNLFNSHNNGIVEGVIINKPKLIIAFIVALIGFNCNVWATGIKCSPNYFFNDSYLANPLNKPVCFNLSFHVNNKLYVNASRSISGFIYDNKKAPLAFALVALIRKSDNKTIMQTYSDTSGSFKMVGEETDLLLKVSLTGYKDYVMDLPAGSTDIVSNPVYMVIDSKQLKEVTISASAPLVRQQVDRLSYNVQADPESKISSVLDMLRKVPLLSVDADDNVKLKGSTSYKVLIDGKESSIVASNPKDVFRSMSASNILRIEVITTPPSKYDSEGLAGIINIITIKKIDDGYSGSAGISYKFPNGPRGNASINLKSGKFGLAAFAGATDYNTPQTNYSITQQGLVNPLTNVFQQGSAKTTSNLEYISTQLSYEIDSLNLITATLGYNRSANHKMSGAFEQQTIDSAYQAYRLNNNGETRGHGYDLGLDYQLGFKRSKTQLLILSYKFSHSANTQSNFITNTDEVNYSQPNYNQYNNSGVNEHTIQLDYTHPLKKLQIEGGVKAILRNEFSDYQVSDLSDSTGTFIPDPDNSNQFNYQQDIYSIYNSYLLTLKKWTFQAGIRDERTTVNATFSDRNTSIPSYNNFIPSLSIQDKLSSSTNLNLGYTERIQRPGIMQLNPFVDQQNPQFITYGNPNLKPELNHVINLSYGIYKNSSVNFGLSYFFSNNSIQYISTLGADGVTRSSFENLGKNKSLEADININWPISQRISLNINGQLSHVSLTGVIDSALYNRKAFAGNGNLYLSYKFDNNWRAGFNFLYYSPNITLQGTSSPYYYTSLSLSKNITPKLNISGSVSNPYMRYLNYKNKTVDPEFYQTTNNQIVYRRVNIGLSYKFGKLKDGSIKKNKKGIENNDIKVVPSTLPGN